MILSYGVKNVWKRNCKIFLKTWSTSLFWTIFEPLFFLGSIGFGVGSYIANMDNLSYIEFYFPALLCVTAMMVSFFESTYGNFTKMNYLKTYSILISAPISVQDLIYGELLWSSSKAFFGIIGVVFVSSFFNLINSWKIILIMVIIALVAWIFSCIGMIVTSLAKNYDSFIYSTSGFIIPLSLFSGTYFPIEQLPKSFMYLAYLSPLTHAVEFCRTVLYKGFTWQLLINLFVLIAFAFVLNRIAHKKMQNKILG